MRRADRVLVWSMRASVAGLTVLTTALLLVAPNWWLGLLGAVIAVPLMVAANALWWGDL